MNQRDTCREKERGRERKRERERGKEREGKRERERETERQIIEKIKAVKYEVGLGDICTIHWGLPQVSEPAYTIHTKHKVSQVNMSCGVHGSLSL